MPVDRHLIERVELAEMRAWEDMYAAAPTGFAERHAMVARRIHGTTVLTSRGLALAHFNSALGMGTQQSVGEAEASAILDCFLEQGAAKFYIHTIAETQGGGALSFHFDGPYHFVKGVLTDRTVMRDFLDVQ